MKIFTIWYKRVLKSRILVTTQKGWTPDDAISRLRKKLASKGIDDIEVIEVFES